jgi:nucleotide-binding universal stress UspA family protein
MLKVFLMDPLINIADNATEASTSDQGVHLATSDVRFNRILVGTDFSEPSMEALKTAIAIGQSFSSKLFIVHAASPFVYTVGTESLPLEIFNANLDAAKQRISQIVMDEPVLKALNTKAIVESAGAIELIGQVARDENVDLIVVGSHGAKGLERLALGSVAETVLRQATCPVLIVGPNCKAEQNPFRSIVFATDLETTGLRGAQYATALAQRVHGKLTFLHVVDRRSSSSGIREELMEEHAKRELQRLLPPHVERYCDSRIRLERGSPAQVITAVAQMESASLVIIGLRIHALADHVPWSTLSNVVRRANCAVLGVRSHVV